MTFLVLQCCPGKVRKRSWQSLCSFVYGNDHKCIKWAFLIEWKSHEWDKCPCFESADYRCQMGELLIMSDFQKKPFVIHEWPQIKCCYVVTFCVSMNHVILSSRADPGGPSMPVCDSPHQVLRDGSYES